MPLRLRFSLPEGAKLVSSTLDGKQVGGGLELQTDLSHMATAIGNGRKERAA